MRINKNYARLEFLDALLFTKRTNKKIADRKRITNITPVRFGFRYMMKRTIALTAQIASPPTNANIPISANSDSSPNFIALFASLTIGSNKLFG